MSSTERVCPERHDHEKTYTCYNNHKCRCWFCVSMHNANQRKRRLEAGANVHGVSDGARDRLRILAARGWACTAIEEHAGVSRNKLYLIRLGKVQKVSRMTHVRIDRAYTKLMQMPAPDTRGARRTANDAKRNGWHLIKDNRA